MERSQWQKLSHVSQTPLAQSWLNWQAQVGRRPNTLDAYGRSLEDYLAFCTDQQWLFVTATREHIASYVRNLLDRVHLKVRGQPTIPRGLSNATVQQRITVVRLFYDYLTEEGLRLQNPVGRGNYRERKAGLVPRYEKLPWIPTDEQWHTILGVARSEPLRNRFMLALAYDAALRREELCSLATQDFDPSHQMLRIRAETTKNRRERIVPYSSPTAQLYRAYLSQRRELSNARGALFLSTSRRNTGKPISIWTWSKVVEGIARKANLEGFTTHSLRHLCLTDLARCGWDIHEIARFAGHRHPQTTLRYIHLSGRDLQAKMAQGMSAIHDWRLATIGSTTQ